MGRKKNTFFDESLDLNMSAYRKYFFLLTELAIGSWEWDGFPDTIDETYIEMCLSRYGKAIYFRDEVMGDLCLSLIDGGNFDVYGYPLFRRAYSKWNGYSRYLNNNNSVVIYNNKIRTNTWNMLIQYSKRLYNYDRIMDVNINAQKTPVALSASEEQRLTVLNAYKEFDGNAPVILTTDKFNPNSFGTLKTDAPFTADKIYTLKTQVWNEALAYLGIRNLNQFKDQRVVVTEANHSNIDAEYIRAVRWSSRNIAVKKINSMFGTNGSVKFIGDAVYRNMAAERNIDGLMLPQENDLTEVDDNEQIHN